jgi:hypothetical protein
VTHLGDLLMPTAIIFHFPSSNIRHYHNTTALSRRLDPEFQSLRG